MATLGLWTFAVFSGVSAALRAKLIGYFASAIFVVLAASPLSTIRTVLAERNSASIYAPLTAAQCANQPAPNLPTPTPMPKPKAEPDSLGPL